MDEIRHITENSKYKLIFERAASTKGVDGFKVEVNSDDFNDAQLQAQALYEWAKNETGRTIEV